MNYRQLRAYRQALGLHPANGMDRGPEGETCGTCGHHYTRQLEDEIDPEKPRQ
mgnify:CR=1 FL=1